MREPITGLAARQRAEEEEEKEEEEEEEKEEEEEEEKEAEKEEEEEAQAGKIRLPLKCSERHHHHHNKKSLEQYELPVMTSTEIWSCALPSERFPVTVLRPNRTLNRALYCWR